MNAIVRPGQSAVIRPVLTPTTFDQLVTFAEMAANSGLVPKDYINKPGAIMIAVQMGSELGLAPMQSIQSIAVINGRPGVWGDGLIGLCRQSPLCQDIVETFEGEGDNRKAVCVATRRGATPTTGEFSVADAKRANLWGKAIWAQYPDRMLRNRARGFALRDAFPDILRGMKTAEELMDTPPDTFRGTTLNAAPLRAAPAESTPPGQPSETGNAIGDQIPDRAIAPKPTLRVLVADKLTAAQSVRDVCLVGEIGLVGKALEEAPEPIRSEIAEMLADAAERAMRPHLADCRTVQEVAAVADIADIRHALSTAAEPIRRRLSDLLSDAYSRAQDAEAEPPTEEPAETSEASA